MQSESSTRRVSRMIVLLILGLLGAAPRSEAVTELQVGTRTFIEDEGTWYVAGELGRAEIHPSLLTVRFDQAAEPSLRASFMDSLGLELHRRGPGDVLHLTVPANLGVLEAFAVCRKREFVAFAEPAIIGHYCKTPSDGLWTSGMQWHLTDSREEFETAWEIETGATSSIVANLNSGVNISHPDLRGNLWRDWTEIPGNGLDDDGDSLVDDHWGWDFGENSGDFGSFPKDGHGSWVTGLVCATTNSDTVGIAGPAGGWCAPDWEQGERGNGVRAMTLGVGSVTSDAVGDALAYAVAHGASVVNMSFGWYDVVPVYVDSMISVAADSGLFMCAAVGNGGLEAQDHLIEFPASDTLVMGVGGVLRNDVHAYFSSYGSGIGVVASTGACLYDSNCDYELREQDDCESLWDQDWPPQYPGCSWFPLSTADTLGLYSRMSGTSASCPQVSALAALLLSVRPELTPAQVRYYIRHSAEDQLGGDTDSLGYDTYYGFGRINAYAALFLAQGGGETISDIRLCHDVQFDRDIKVGAGTTLTILSGVDITFTSGSDSANLGVDSARCELIVEGTLVAEDNSGTLPITFTTTTDSAGAWYGVRAPTDNGSIHLDNCVIENAWKGLSVDNPEVLDAENLTIDDCVSHGIFLDNCSSGVVVENCTITDPGLIGIEARDCTGIALSGHDISNAAAYGIKATAANSLTISDNTILGSETGLEVVGIRCGGADSTSTFTISGNMIERCGYQGMYVRYGTGDGGLVTGNCLSDTAYTRGGTGICFNYSSAKVRSNIVEDKTHGVVAICGEAGSPSPFWVPDLGDTTEENGDNSLLDNSLYFVWTLGLDGHVLKAENNWFGGAPSSQKFYGRVDRDPYLTSPPTRAGGSSGGEDARPERVALEQNRPNPFNPTTSISYTVPDESRVLVRVYSASGRLVSTLVDETVPAGTYERVWDGRADAGHQLPSGVYFLRLDVDGTTRTRKLVLLK